MMVKPGGRAKPVRPARLHARGKILFPLDRLALLSRVEWSKGIAPALALDERFCFLLRDAFFCLGISRVSVSLSGIEE